MKHYCEEFLLFLNLSGRYGHISDFTSNELQILLANNNITFNSDWLAFNSFTNLRKINNFASNRLYKTLKKSLKIMSYVKGIKQVAICNSFSFRNQTLNSDLDFFLILDHKSFFTTRLLLLVLFKFFGLKRSNKKIINRVCFSFLISDKNLNLSKVRFQNDYYLKFWLDNLVFLGTDLDLKNKFFNINHAVNSNSNFFNKISKIPLYFQSKTFSDSFLLNKFETFNTWYQINRANRKYNNLGKPVGIKIKPGFLKFHNVDIRPDFNRKFSEFLY